MRHKIGLPLSLAFLLAACQSQLPSASKGTFSSDVVSSESSLPSSTSSTSSSSTTTYLIHLEKNVTSLAVGATLQLSYQIEPAAEKEVVFSSSNEDVLTVSAKGLVTAIAKGNATITIAFADDPTVNDSLTLEVVPAPLTVKDFQAKLTSLREKEKTSAISGKIAYQAKNLSQTRDFTAYKDSLQTVDSTGATTLYTKVGNDLTALTLTSTSVAENVLGTIGNDTTAEIVDNAIHLCPWGSFYGVSGVLLDALTSTSFVTGNLAKENLTFTMTEENGKTTYVAKTYYPSQTNADALQVNAITFVEENGTLARGEYRYLSYLEGFDKTTFALQEGATPASQEIFEATLQYGERVESDDTRLNRSDYLIQSYDIDTSAWRKGEAKLYVGDKVPLAMTNVSPALHLADVLSVPDGGISNPSIVASEKSGDVTYLTALKAGTATITTTTYYGKTKQLTVTVSEVPPERIEINPNALKTLEIGQTSPYKVTITPAGLSDSTFTASFTDSSMAELAELTLNQENSYFQLKALKAGTVTVRVAAHLDPSITDEITVTIPEASSIAIDKKTTSIEVGSSASYAVKVQSSVFTDLSFKAAFQDSAMKEFATLTPNAANSSFSLTALKEGSVTVVVTSVADPTLTDSITVAITPKATVEPIDALHQAMIGKTYNGAYGSTSVSITFAEASGTVTLGNGNKYSFAYTLGTYGTSTGKTRVNFSNVKPIADVATNKIFDGSDYNSSKRNAITNDAKKVMLNIKNKTTTGSYGSNYTTLTVVSE